MIMANFIDNGKLFMKRDNVKYALTMDYNISLRVIAVIIFVIHAL